MHVTNKISGHFYEVEKKMTKTALKKLIWDAKMSTRIAARFYQARGHPDPSAKYLRVEIIMNIDIVPHFNTSLIIINDDGGQNFF